MPADVFVSGQVSVYDVAPTAFLRHGDPRLLDGALDWEDFDRDPLSEPGDLGAATEGAPSASAELTLELDIDEARPGATLWIVACNWRACATRAPMGFAPIVLSLPPIDGPTDSIEARVELAPLGGVRGSVEVSGVVDGIGVGQTRTVSVDACLSSRLVCRARASDVEGLCGGGRFSLWPLSGGAHEIEVCTDDCGHAYRFVVAADVCAGRTVDVGELRLAATREVLELCATDEAGEPLSGELELALTGWPSRTIRVSDAGQLVLHGDWSVLAEVQFTPNRSAEFESVTEPIDLNRAARTVAIVAPRRALVQRSVVVTAVAPEGRRVGAAMVAFERQGSGARWRKVVLGFDSGGCVRQLSSLFDPGRHELVAWMPCCELSYVGPIDVPTLADDADGDYQRIDLPFVRSGTSVRGTVRGTYRGLDVAWPLELTVGLDGAAERQRRGWRDPALELAGDRRVIDIDGLPADVDLELVLWGEWGPLLVLPFRLEVGEQLDLGELVVEHE